MRGVLPAGPHFHILELDHVIPKSRGGTDHIENLQLLCPSCNRIKGGPAHGVPDGKIDRDGEVRNDINGQLGKGHGVP